MSRRWQLFLCFAAAFSIAQSQTLSTDLRSRFEFERIGLAEGLPNEYVNCIAQDQFGFMWFGTKNELCRYDGQKFKTYQSVPGDSTSLPGNEILLLFSDSRGNLWVGANGLCRFNFSRENFTRLAPPRYGAIFEKLKFVSPICEDNTGNLWLGTFGQGLFKFNPVSNELTPIALDGVGSRSIIYSLSTNGADTIWIASNNHQVTALNIRTLQQKRYTLAQTGDIQKVFADRAGRLWLGPMGEPLQQMHWRTNGEVTFTRFENIKLAHFFNCFGDDRNGNLWIGSQLEGVYVLNIARNETRLCRYNSRDIRSLPGEEVQMFFEDRSGNMWIATNKGVGMWARWRKPFRHFQYDTENSNSLNNAEVTGIDQDENGNLWISTLNAGFCKFNPRTGDFTRYDPSTCGIKSPWALEILAGRNGWVWIATNFQHGLNRFDPATGKFKEYLHNPQDPASLSSNLVTTLFEDGEARVWIGAANRGLNLYDPRRDGFRRFQHDRFDSTTLSHNNVLSIYEDKASTLWIGTSHGLNRFDAKSESFVRYFAAETAGERLAVYSIHEDSRRRFWLGTNFGLYLFDRHSGKFERFADLPELPDKRIFGILEDGAGKLWLQTTTAIAKFDPQARALRIYDRDDGWIQNAVYEQEWMHASAPLSSGELVFGGANGITIFHPDSIKDNPNVPPVYLTGFNLFYEAVDFNKNPAGRRARSDSLLRRSLLLTDKLILRHNENTFSFEFAALDYTQPEANQYAYKLEGFHGDWVNSGNVRTATFTNIPAGEYTFRVKGANNDGLWNETGASIKITILPPWWRTTTAYISYAALLLALLYGARRFEMNRLKMRNELKMKNFEAQKLREVDHLKSRFFANISHEFRTPLTLILGPLEDVIAKVKDQAAKEELHVMGRNAQRLLRLINQLLDLSRLESGTMALHARRGDFIAFLKGIVMSFASLAEQKKIVLKFEDQPSRHFESAGEVEIYFDRDKIEKIFYNLLSNAFKFTPEGGSIEVMVGSVNVEGRRTKGDGRALPPSPLALPNSFVEITVKDTGIGIPADRLSYIFDRFYQVDDAHTREHEGTGIGLALTKELVERHYGAIEVRSEEGKGTEFIVRLPVGKERFKPEEIVEEVASEQPSVISGQLPEIDDVPIEQRRATSDQQPVAAQRRSRDSGTTSRGAAKIPAQREDQDIILVVDDHPDMRQFIRRHLEPAYHVIEAKDGRDGVASALEAIPDLIISDVMMPKLDGYQLCEALKTNEKTSHIPVILLTAKAGEESKLAGLETGADDYLVKPFNSRELQLRAHNLIDQRRKLRERFRREGLLQPRQVVVPSAEEAFLQKLMAILEENLAEEEFGVEQLSEALHLGRRQLLRKLRSLTGQPPVDFIRSVRLQRARQLLEQKAGSVSEIAYMVGFSNLSYFAKAFREEFGILPSELASKS